MSKKTPMKLPSTTPLHSSQMGKVYTQEPNAQNAPAPWETIENPSIKKVFNLRISSKHHAMLMAIGKQDEHSTAQSFLKKIVIPAIEKEAERLKKLNRF